MIKEDFGKDTFKLTFLNDKFEFVEIQSDLFKNQWKMQNENPNLPNNVCSSDCMLLIFAFITKYFFHPLNIFFT